MPTHVSDRQRQHEAVMHRVADHEPKGDAQQDAADRGLRQTNGSPANSGTLQNMWWICRSGGAVLLNSVAVCPWPNRRYSVTASTTRVMADAAQALLRLDFASADRRRMNRLAEKNRQGRLSPREEQELDSFIRAGQLLGILQSKARQSLKAQGQLAESNP
jgi:hypothetical protein